MELTQDNSTLIRALKDLDERLRKRCKGLVTPIELNCVGGFALMANKIRLNPDEFTDIDYIGDDFNEQIRDIIDEVGVKYNLGKKWLNNDVLLAGSSCEDIEFAVGKLHFTPMLQLSVFAINVLVPVDLMRMKVIALDTTLIAARAGAEFTRLRDFKDVADLMRFLGWDTQKLIEQTSDYVLESETFELIDEYIKTGSNKLFR